MFTVCPKCTKQFRLFAEHIAAASGQVRCGFCNTQFNALAHLHDEPLSNEKISKIVQPEPELGQELLIEPGLDIPGHEQTVAVEPDNGLLGIVNEANTGQQDEAEPEFDIPEYNETELSSPDNGLLNTIDEASSDPIIALDSEPVAAEKEQLEVSQFDQDLIISNDVVDSVQELDTAIQEIGIDVVAEDNKIQISDEAHDKNTSEQIAADKNETHYTFPDIGEGIPEEPLNRRWIATFFWASVCSIGLIALVLQLSWFNRDDVLIKYPQLTPYVKQVCNELDCRIIRQRNTQAIKLVNRDVRLHPSYQDTLLVNATMNNELSVRQPYPRVQLTLFDTSGALLGHRKFFPDDYLDESIDLDKGMPVNIPVHFVLEVSGPTAGAVSFEFRFL
jgi:predicted Zn finger-like uncharacterized protein